MRNFYLSMAVAAVCAVGSVESQAAEYTFTPADGSTITPAEFAANDYKVKVGFSEAGSGNAGTWTLVNETTGETVSSYRGQFYLGFGNKSYELFFNGMTTETPRLDAGTYKMTIKAGAFTFSDGKSPELSWTFTIGEAASGSLVDITPADGAEFANPNAFNNNNTNDGMIKFYFGQNVTTMGTGTMGLYRNGLSAAVWTYAASDAWLMGPDDGFADYSMNAPTFGAIKLGGDYELIVPAGFFVINGTNSPEYRLHYTIGNPELETFTYDIDVQNGATYELLPSNFELMSDKFQVASADVEISEELTVSFTQESTGTTWNLESSKMFWDMPGERSIQIALPETDTNWPEGSYKLEIPKGVYTLTDATGEQFLNAAGIYVFNVGTEVAPPVGNEPLSIPSNNSTVKTLKDIIVYFPNASSLDRHNYDPYKPVITDGEGNELAYKLSWPEIEAYKWNGIVFELASEISETTVVKLNIPTGFFVVDDVQLDEPLEFTYNVAGGVAQPKYQFSPSNEEMVRSLSEITLSVQGATTLTLDQSKQATLTNTTIQGLEGEEPETIVLEAYRSAVNTNLVTFELPANTEMVNGYWTLTVPAGMLNITMPEGEVSNKEIKIEYELRQFADVRVVVFPDTEEVQKEISSIIIAFPDSETAYFEPDYGWALYNADTMEDIPMDYLNLESGDNAGKATEFIPRKKITKAGVYEIRLYPGSFTIDGTMYDMDIIARWTVEPSGSSVEGVAADQIEKVEYFDLTGVEVLNPEAGSVLIRRTILSGGEVRVEKVVVK